MTQGSGLEEAEGQSVCEDEQDKDWVKFGFKKEDGEPGEAMWFSSCLPLLRTYTGGVCGPHVSTFGTSPMFPPPARPRFRSREQKLPDSGPVPLLYIMNERGMLLFL